ncbi:MAG: hypothetical protein AAGG57_15825, partial [Pseudomonadota bacterium]
LIFWEQCRDWPRPLLVGYVSDGFQQTAPVEPMHPFKAGVVDGIKAPPWAKRMNDFGLEKAVDCLNQGVVIPIPWAADRRFDQGFGRSFGVASR